VAGSRDPEDLLATLPEESAEELYEHAPAGYLSALPGGLIVRVNETLLGWTGYGRDELVGRKRVHDLLAPGARIYYETHYAPLLRMQGSVREIAVELVRADGSRLPVLLNSTLVLDDDGEPWVVRTTVFDATDRRRYERELLRARGEAEERARAALALAHVNEGVVLVDRDGRVEAANAAARTILGVDVLAGSPVAEVVPGWSELAEHVPVGRPGERTPPATLPLPRDGVEQWLEVAGVDAGEGVVYTFRDITSEHGLEQLRSDLAAIVSHELRTPLTGVLGAAQTLRSRWDALDEDARLMLLEMVLEQGKRLESLVEQVLLASRLDTGEIEIEAARFDPAALLDEVAAAVPAERLQVERGDAPEAAGDPGMTRQVLLALVDNALKYSTGPVRIAVASEGAAVRFTVADEGPGIPQSERNRVFDKFYRLDPSLKAGVGGTGLGLYVARELVLRMGGAIGFVDGGPGTTVFVRLPRA
jgi:PAS domain S-box-containing protein